MQNPQNLRVTGFAEELAVAVYDFTAAFPPTERFGLTSQMRRAAVSVGSNVCEGCGRARNRSMRPFLHYALGSAEELRFQVRLAARLSFGEPTQARDLTRRLALMIRMLTHLITRAAGAQLNPR